jgi:NDP-sugar pyrophosphorylase family protein
LQVLILAGGRGMRLLPLSNDLPPSLLFLPGGSILSYLLHHAAALAPERTALVLQYHGDQIARHLGGARPGLDLIPQGPPWTLLSALASAASWVEEPTLVLHGNHYFSHDLAYFVEQADPEVPSFLVPPENFARCTVAQTGAYILPPRAFALVEQAVRGDHPSALYGMLAEAKMQPQLVPLRGWAQAIHTAADLLTVNHYLLRHWHEAMHPREAGVGYDAMNLNWIAPDAKVDREVPGFFVTIGPKASVSQSYLYNTLVFPGVQVLQVKEQNVVLAGNGDSLLRLYSTAPHRADDRRLTTDDR